MFREYGIASAAQRLRSGLPDYAGVGRFEQHSQPLAAAVLSGLERARQRRAGGPAARTCVCGPSGSGNGATGDFERLDRRLQEVFPHRQAAEDPATCLDA